MNDLAVPQCSKLVIMTEGLEEALRCRIAISLMDDLWPVRSVAVRPWKGFLAHGRMRWDFY